MMFYFVFPLLVVISGFGCASSSTTCLHVCICLQKLKLVDCSRRMLTTIPGDNRVLISYTSLTLRDNNIQRINSTSLRSILPNLRKIDLRGNPIDCSWLWRENLEKIKVISHCSKPPMVTSTTAKVIFTTHKHELVTEPISTTYTQEPVTTYSSTNSTVNNIQNDEGVQSYMVYGPILGVVFIIVLVLIIYGFYRRRANEDQPMYSMDYIQTPAAIPSLSSSSSSNSSIHG